MEIRFNNIIMDLEKLIRYLSVEEPKLATQRKIAKQIIEKLDPKAVNRYLKALSQDENWVCRSLSCFLISFCYQTENDKEQIKKILLKLADDKDWRVKESLNRLDVFLIKRG